MFPVNTLALLLGVIVVVAERPARPIDQIVVPLMVIIGMPIASLLAVMTLVRLVTGRHY